MSTRRLPIVHEELWLEHRLVEQGLIDGRSVAGEDSRRERIRRAILHGQLATVVVGRRADGKAERYAEAFERIYGQALGSGVPREAE